jgi:hypothetical protein
MATETESKRAEAPKVPPAPPVPTVGIIADRDLYLDEHQREIVERGDAKARYLLAARGGMIPPDAVQRHGLSAKGGKVVQASAAERAKAAKESGLPLDLGTPNEGQLRAPGEPLILAPRTAIMRGEAAPREIHKPGDEVPVQPRTVAVSNVPPEDDELRVKVAEETRGPEYDASGQKKEAPPARSPAAAKKVPAAKKAGVRRRPKGAK